MTIRFFNTLSGKVEELKPINPKQVRMYTCGPTVYDDAHIGNFRAFVFEDLLRRFLEFEGFRVNHVMNLTDVDDKTIAGAIREKQKLDDFTQRYIQSFQEDLKTLHILTPSKMPRATHEIKEMLSLIEKLIKNGSAYESEGSVYYRVSSFKNYGKLSKKKLEENIEGARVDVDEYEKEQGADFVLWKKSKEGEPAWDSPWGKGRPGWHIECSAMSMKYLGETFDIHAGGEDLVFPHHENEIAQSEAATGNPFVHYWLHCRFLLVDGEKMSKSKGNFYTLRDLIAKKYDPMAIRYLLLATHYRSPLNFTLAGLAEASEIIKKLDDCYFRCLSLCDHPAINAKNVLSLEKPLTLAKKGMREALENDLNISESLAAYFQGVKEINRALADNELLVDNLRYAVAFFQEADKLYGFDIADVEHLSEDVQKKLYVRDEIRKDPRFKSVKLYQIQSDGLRKEIEIEGWLIKDGRPGEFSTVKKKRRTWDQ